jgi:hypothetical protein
MPDSGRRRLVRTAFVEKDVLDQCCEESRSSSSRSFGCEPYVYAESASSSLAEGGGSEHGGCSSAAEIRVVVAAVLHLTAARPSTVLWTDEELITVFMGLELSLQFSHNPVIDLVGLHK